MGPLLFLVYINDLPLRINSLAEPVLFADDTSVIISNINFIDFSTSANPVLAHMIEWFSANMLVLNLEKTNIMKFLTINLPYCALTIGHKDKYIEEVVNLKFLGIQTDNHFNWKNHTDQIIFKLGAACYIVRQMYYIRNNDTLRSIYLAYFHCIVSYGIIFWGNSFNSKKIFTWQKRIIRIMVGAHPKAACRNLFKKLEILTVPSQCIYSLMRFFLIGNLEKFQTNSSVHSINTRNKHRLHRPVANLSCFQKGISYSGIRIFNNLPRVLEALKMKRHSFK